MLAMLQLGKVEEAPNMANHEDSDRNPLDLVDDPMVAVSQLPDVAEAELWEDFAALRKIGEKLHRRKDTFCPGTGGTWPIKGDLGGFLADSRERERRPE